MSFFKSRRKSGSPRKSMDQPDPPTSSPTAKTAVDTITEAEGALETCPICCNDLSASDVLYKLLCPTDACHFCYCSDCLRGMQQASKDDYQQASDGSLQVKVKLMCPQCRTPYKSKTYAGETVVEAVLLLRQAYAVQKLLGVPDDDLSASALADKAEFCSSTSLEQVQTALQRIETYDREIRKGVSLPQLDWEKLKDHLHGTGEPTTQAAQIPRNWKDPTLFLGLESLLSPDEQEFMTQLLTSGKPELLVQASFILYQMIHHPKAATKAVQQLAQFSTPFDSAKLQKLRQRYPLPRMPVCVPLPPVEPSTFLSKLQMNDQLVLKSTRGGIGKFGVRNGDVLTHLGDVAVGDRTDLEQALSAASGGGGAESLTLTVNASLETAQALRDRALKMQADKVRFF